MGAMKDLLIDLTEEIYFNPSNSRWKCTRRNKPYSWEEAQEQVTRIAQQYGTNEIVAKIFHPNEPKKYPTITKWHKIWKDKQKWDLVWREEKEKAETKVREEYIAKRWPNGVPKPKWQPWHDFSESNKKIYLQPKPTKKQLAHWRKEKSRKELEKLLPPITDDKPFLEFGQFDPKEIERDVKIGRELIKNFHKRWKK